MGEPFYFGCWTRPGHELRRVDGSYVRSSGFGTEFRWGVELPWGHRIDGTLNPSARQGEAAIHHRDGWTALAWADYSVDDRPGSNCAVFLPGTLTFEEAVEAAKRAFPTVMGRQPVPLFDTAASSEER